MSDQDHCEMLWDHLDGTLGQAEESAFRDHLEHCAICRTELAEHQAIAVALRPIGDEEPPATIRAAVRAEFRRLHEQPERAPMPAVFRPRWAFPVPAWAAAALLAFGILAGVSLAPRGGPVGNSPVAPASTEASPAMITYSIYQTDGSVKTVSRLARAGGSQGDDAPERNLR